MVFASSLLTKKGPYGKVWLAAHWDKKLTRMQVFQTDITKSVDSISNPKEGMPLRVSGSLLLGLVRIYSHKVRYLSTDCDDALSKMKMAFRPGAMLTSQSSSKGLLDQDDIEDFDNEAAGAGGAASVARPRRSTTTYSDVGGGHHNSNTRRKLAFQRLTIDDLLPPMGNEWLDAAAQTMARKQDITMDEATTSVGRSSTNFGAGGGHDGLMLDIVKKEESEGAGEGFLGTATNFSQEGGGGGGGASQSSAAGGGGETVEHWEAFDPSKLGMDDDDDEEEEEGQGTGEQENENMEYHNGDALAFGAGGADDDDDDPMYDDDNDHYDLEEEPEVGRLSHTAGEGAEDSLELTAGAGRRESVSSSKRDLEEDSTLLSLGGGAGGDSNGYDAMDVVDETAASPGEGGQGLSLRESLDGGSGDEYLGDHGRDGEGEGKEDVYAMSTSNKKNRIRFSEVSRLSMGGSGAGTGGRIESRGRKRRLPIDNSLHISNPNMKAQLADYSDLLMQRVRPRDRVKKRYYFHYANTSTTTIAAGSRTAGDGLDLFQQGEGEDDEEEEGQGKMIKMNDMGPVEARLGEHALTGVLGGNLEEVFTLMMKTGRQFRLPVAKRGLADLLQAREQAQQQRLVLASPTPSHAQKSPSASTKKRTRGEEEAEEAKYDTHGEGRRSSLGVEPLQNGGGQEEEELDFGGGDDGFRMDDDDNNFYSSDDGGGDGYMHAFGLHEEDEDEKDHGDDDDDDNDDDDDDGFIRQNAAGEDDDHDGTGAAGNAYDTMVGFSSSTTKWHPNTIKMCKLLRARMRSNAETEGGGGGEGSKSVRFSQLTRNNGRTKAANKFWEVLQLSTWGLIDVHQPRAYADVIITATPRFDETIP